MREGAARLLPYPARGEALGRGQQVRSHILELAYQQMLEYDIMTVHDETIAKIRRLPESLVQEVSDFVDFLLAKYNRESLEIAESDFSDYLSNLEDYEERLARGEIQW